MIYKFKTGLTYKGVDAQTAGDELERIRRANGGRLETAEVVRWAAEPDSPLHGCFTWDTERAAREYHLQEARQLIRAVVVVTAPNEPPAPAFWNIAVTVPTEDEGETKTEHYYQSAEVVSQNPVEFQSALRLMLRELVSAEKGLAQLRRLAPRGTKTRIDRATGQVRSAQKELTEIAPGD